MQSLSNFVKGIFIGVGAILPGISSGVICMVVGLYEKLLDSILGFFKNTKKNFKFLLPIVLGAIVGCVLFSNILVYFFNTIPIQTKSLFIGLLLGSIYILYKSESKNELNANHSFSLSAYLSFIICFFIGIGLIYFENHIIVSNAYYANEYSFLFLVLSGFFMSMGIVIPRSK